MSLKPRRRTRRTIRLELTAGEIEHVQEAVQQYLHSLPTFVAQAFGLDLITMWFKICRQIRQHGGAYRPLRLLPRWAEPLVADAVLRFSQRDRSELPTTLRGFTETAPIGAGGGGDGQEQAAGPERRRTHVG